MWIKIIPSKVFTRLNTKAKNKLINTYNSDGKKFGEAYFTTSDKMPTKPKFPVIYLKKMQNSAQGRTLEDSRVNAILSTFQIEIYTNTNQTDAEIVADVVADFMIDMGYEMVGDPFPDNTADVFKNTSRWQRLIGYNDVINF